MLTCFLIVVGLFAHCSIAEFSGTLPDVCVCNFGGAAPVINRFRCEFRPSGSLGMTACLGFNIDVFNRTMLNSEFDTLSCSCVSGFPACKDVDCFATMDVSPPASYAVISPPAQKNQTVDIYTGLEYLYGESFELLMQYRSTTGSYGTDLRRKAAPPATDQNFWYGFHATAEVLWNEKK